jgi:Zn finger protein HypA/HybF involved in hydrogenase expression
MIVPTAGQTTASKVLHAIDGKWNYEGQNTSLCGVKLAAQISLRNSPVEVTCKNCLRSKKSPKTVFPRGFALEFPYADGKPVTELHKLYCKENGHASNKIYGRIQSNCPTCGEVTLKTEESYTAKIEEMTVTVSKIGGGTVGKKYEGNWEITVTDYRGRVIFDRETITTKTPKDHEYVALVAVDFAQDPWNC